MRVIPHEFGGGPPMYVFKDIEELIEWIKSDPEAFIDAIENR